MSEIAGWVALLFQFFGIGWQWALIVAGVSTGLWMIGFAIWLAGVILWVGVAVA